ncbi:hypothetical protein C8R43DRAFT_956125 [Mycena crocata]|nr:hypothetical protein C8R43DRAFT_956125 [Mycena crocata]
MVLYPTRVEQLSSIRAPHHSILRFQTLSAAISVSLVHSVQESQSLHSNSILGGCFVLAIQAASDRYSVIQSPLLISTVLFLRFSVVYFCAFSVGISSRRHLESAHCVLASSPLLIHVFPVLVHGFRILVYAVHKHESLLPFAIGTKDFPDLKRLEVIGIPLQSNQNLGATYLIVILNKHSDFSVA